MRLVRMMTICLVLSFSGMAHAEESAQEIIDKALDRNAMGFQSGMANLQLKIQDSKGVKIDRSLEVRSRKISDRTHTLVKLTAPKEVFGQSFLFAEGSGENDVWMYMPAFKVTRRIEGNQKNGSFLGSHFTYADFESRDLKDATHQKLPDEKIGKNEVFVIESTPKDKSSEYSKTISYIRKSDYIPLKIRFFGKDSKVAKTLFIEKLDKSEKGQTYAKQMTLRPEGGGQTTIIISSLSEAEIPESVFSKDQLGK